jgi:hypothetical protein
MPLMVDPAAPSPLPGRAEWLTALACATTLGVVYGLDLWRWSQAHDAPVHVVPLPSPLLAGLALVAALVGLGLTAFGASRRRTTAWRGYRALPIATVVILFGDLLVRSSLQSPLSSADRGALALAEVSDVLQQRMPVGTVHLPQEALDAALEGLPPFPWAAPGARWRIVRRIECGAPVHDADGEPAGTFIYCEARGGEEAWLSLIALPQAERFGAPAPLGLEAPWVGHVLARLQRPPAP